MPQSFDDSLPSSYLSLLILKVLAQFFHRLRQAACLFVSLSASSAPCVQGLCVHKHVLPTLRGCCKNEGSLKYMSIDLIHGKEVGESGHAEEVGSTSQRTVYQFERTLGPWVADALIFTYIYSDLLNLLCILLLTILLR